MAVRNIPERHIPMRTIPTRPNIHAFRFVQYDNGMQMVGHQNEFAQKQFRAHLERFEKFVINDLSPIVQHHFTVHDFAEQPLAIGGDDGDVIMPVAGIIPSPQTV